MNPLKILIADDEALIRMDMKELLEEAGHEVVGEAPNGRKAVELFLGRCTDATISFLSGL